MRQQVENGQDPNKDLLIEQSGSKAEAALNLRISGASYSDIAHILEYKDHYQSRVAVEKLLATISRSETSIEKERTLHKRRLERLLGAVMPTATNTRAKDQILYHQQAMRTLDRIAALGGLNAPTQQIVYTPKQEEIEKYVAQMQVLNEQDARTLEAEAVQIDSQIDKED